MQGGQIEEGKRSGPQRSANPAKDASGSGLGCRRTGAAAYSIFAISLFRSYYLCGVGIPRRNWERMVARWQGGEPGLFLVIDSPE